MTHSDPGVRQTLSSVLRPPAGFRLDAAAGTSFTLDLRTLLAVPLTFALLDGVEIGPANESSSEEETPAAPVLLSALLAYAERIRVVSDARYISAPTRPSRLYSLLEPAIKPVVVASGAHFHPKFWLSCGSSTRTRRPATDSSSRRATSPRTGHGTWSSCSTRTQPGSLQRPNPQLTCSAPPRPMTR